MKKIASLLLVLVTVLLLSACGNDTDLEEVTIVLDWTPNTNHTGLYVALENGYFEEAGLDVEIIIPQGTSEQLVASNTAQFGISAEEYVIASRASGLPVVSIMGILAENTSGFISRAEENIQSPKDFEGKTYCGWGSPTESAIIKELVESDGGDFSLVDIQTNYLDIFTDANKDCDFFWVFEAWQVEEAKRTEIDYNYLSMVDYSTDLNFYTPVLITNEDMISDNPETVQAVVDAVVRGYEYAIENPTEAANILLTHAPELNADLVQASQVTISDFYKGTDVDFGFQKDTYWTTFYNWLLTNEIITEITIEDAYTNEFLND